MKCYRIRNKFHDFGGINAVVSRIMFQNKSIASVVQRAII